MEVVMDQELGETVDKSSVWLLVRGEEEPMIEVTTIFSGVTIGTVQVEVNVMVMTGVWLRMYAINQDRDTVVHEK
jgi:hypothetical protein